MSSHQVVRRRRRGRHRRCPKDFPGRGVRRSVGDRPRRRDWSSWLVVSGRGVMSLPEGLS